MMPAATENAMVTMMGTVSETIEDENEKNDVILKIITEKKISGRRGLQFLVRL